MQRYISPCEAMWRIYGFEINYRKPAVERLRFHLENEQPVLYADDDDLEEVIEEEKNLSSMFLAWMEANMIHPVAKTLTYVQFPTMFVYESSPPTWRPRKKGFSIGRLTFVPPAAGELFYLSILLHRVKGPENYAQIRTVNGIEYPTFKEACYKLGLLDDDREFISVLEEAAHWVTGNQLSHGSYDGTKKIKMFT
ncbi:hypothetical protein RIF29_19379 [Crotalaria pallida]|uniref:Uncharacterized protein n=1 Tax=Crotalaria pallida TaxID=3830 RepID=A0AAN9F3C5_CROPI